MKRVFCVQSISDIITNSSSEVFVLYDDNALKNIKDLVNAVLAAADTKLTFFKALSSYKTKTSDELLVIMSEIL